MERKILRTARSRQKEFRHLHIGLTGSMASGKGELARFLKGLNFSYISLSDMVREAASQKGQKNISRQNMQNIGNKLRQQGGPGILAKQVRKKINSTKKKTWIIDGIRNPEEVIELKKLTHFYLIGVKSDLEVLLKRLNSRNRETDQAQPSELKQVLRREWGNGEPTGGQQVGRCMELADFTIENNGTLMELKKKCQKILSLIEDKYVR